MSGLANPHGVRAVPGRILGVVVAVLGLALSGCSAPLVEAGQPSPAAGTIPLQHDRSIGQSLMAYQGGLMGIDLQIVADPTAGPGQVAYQLRRSAESNIVLASGSAALVATSPSVLRLSFPPQGSERLQDFYIELQYSGPPGYALKQGAADAYLNGAAYIDGQPREAQLTFSLVHDPVQATIGLMQLLLQWVLFAVAAAAVLVLPGYALLGLLPPGLRADASRRDRLLIAPAVSVAVYPVVLIVSDLVGLRPGAGAVWAPVLIAIALLAAQARRTPRWPLLAQRSLESLAFWLVAGAIIFTRLWAIRALDAPMWGDSVHHSTITQLMLERGGLFNDWKPYAESLSLTYHIGFHSNAAAWGWLANADGPTATLWMGQFLNIAAVLGIYPLARRMTGRPWSGVIAMGFAGLVSTHPAFFVNWGRYTQLTGQVALLGVLWLFWGCVMRPGLPVAGRRRATWLAVIGLTWAGLAFAHYRILILALAFLLPTALLVLRARDLRRGLLHFVGGGLIGLVLFLPWLTRMFSGRLPALGAELLQTPASQVPDIVTAINDGRPALDAFFPNIVWLALGVIGLVGLWRRERSVGAVLLGGLAMLAATNPASLGIAGTALITNFALLLVAYVPAGLLMGWAGGALAARLESLPPRRGRVLTASAAVVIAGLFGAGGLARLREVAPQSYALLTRPDLRAFAWIRQNTPADARFGVNAFPAYGGGLIAGSDGGWWLTLMTRRQTSLPPMTYNSERPPWPSYVSDVNALSNDLRRNGLTDAMLSRLRAAGITHFYVGQSHGATPRDGAPALLDVTTLEHDPRLRMVYAADRVRIFELNTAVR